MTISLSFYGNLLETVLKWSIIFQKKEGIPMTDSSVTIRMAAPEDAASLLAIYRPYVEKTAITFEYEVPSVEEFAGRIRHVLTRFPYLAAEKDGKLLGYAYVSPFKERAAYDWAVETSIYVAEDARGCGTGSLLYRTLEEILKAQNITNLNACITYPHPESISFHERFGYKTVAHFTKCGYKLDTWWDMVWMEKMLSNHPEKPQPVIPVTQLELPHDFSVFAH
jgi:phosphinothricin acetyltransferase